MGFHQITFKEIIEKRAVPTVMTTKAIPRMTMMTFLVIDISHSTKKASCTNSRLSFAPVPALPHLLLDPSAWGATHSNGPT
jgi:hypothetical protein